MSVESFAHLSFRGPGRDVLCDTDPERTPILSIDGPPLSLSFTPRSALRVTPAELAFYRLLHARLGVFLTECAKWAGGES